MCVHTPRKLLLLTNDTGTHKHTNTIDSLSVGKHRAHGLAQVEHFTDSATSKIAQLLQPQMKDATTAWVDKHDKTSGAARQTAAPRRAAPPRAPLREANSNSMVRSLQLQHRTLSAPLAVGEAKCREKGSRAAASETSSDNAGELSVSQLL